MELNIIPKVNKAIVNDSDTYILTKESRLSISTDCPRAGELLKKITGLRCNASLEEKASVRLELSEKVGQGESYLLRIASDGIVIAAGTEQGLFYGVQTFRQLLPVSAEAEGITDPVFLPHLRIEDAPRFGHRGFMLDEARLFFGVAEVKRIIELLAMLKLNRFHWHLTDHQGWRIEIKKYPKLTEIGSVRSKSQINISLTGKAVYDQQEVSGYYTQEQIKEIVQYAKDRFIEVIPEIDIPGHSYAALAAYPELSCDGLPVEVGTDFLATSFITLPKSVCPGKEEVYHFFQGVLDEVMPLFPFGTIHLGSDEAGRKVWRKCPRCKDRMKENGLKNTKQLQGYFINRVAGYLLEKGWQVICWNDGLYDNADERIIIQHWLHSRRRTMDKVKEGRRAIVSTMKPYYLDYTYTIATLKDTYEYEPLSRKLTGQEHQNILGIEAPLWTEFVKTRERMDWQLFPRLLAVSETAWTDRENKEFKNFESRLPLFEQRLKKMEVYPANKQCYSKSISHSFQLDMLRNRHPADIQYEKYNK